MGNNPLYCPLSKWANLWLTLPRPLGSLKRHPRGLTNAVKASPAGAEETSGSGAVQAPVPSMNAQQLLQEISDYCRQTGLAESTFGRRAVNDGKLAARLRNGGRITTHTLAPPR